MFKSPALQEADLLRGSKSLISTLVQTVKNLIDRIAGNGWKIPNDIVPQEYKGA